MLTNEDVLGGITIVHLAANRLTATALPVLLDSRDKMLARGRHAMLIDLAKVRRITAAGIGALVEFSAEFGAGRTLAFCNAAPAIEAKLTANGLAHLLRYFSTREQALANQTFRSQRLSGTKALILCAGAGTRMAPLTQTCPKPLLPLFGTPVLSHILAHLAQYGIHDVLLNPGHLGDQFFDLRSPSPLQRMQFFNEGELHPSGWRAAPLGSASTLARLHHSHNALTSDLVVLCGDALVNIDLPAMMQAHRDSGAMVTLAAQKVPRQDCHKYGIMKTDRTGRVLAFQEKPTPDQAVSNLANTGIYIFNPAVTPYLKDTTQQDIATHLLPELLAHGGHLHVYEDPFEWVDLGCPRDYAQAHFSALEQRLHTLKPVGDEVRPGLWSDTGASISRYAKISGSCFVGRNTVIERSVEIKGPCVIGENCLIKGPSLINNSILFAGTKVQPGAWIDGQITSARWSISHAEADGILTPLLSPPLDRVEAMALGTRTATTAKGIRA